MVRRVISEEASRKTALALESVVTNGTGRNAFIDGYRVGGKTGTAQKVKDGAYMSGNYILSFIGFLPADNPKVVVYVAIDNPKGVTQYGGTIAAPIAKNILTDAISALNIEPSLNVTEKKYQWYDTKYYTVPNVVGKSVAEAKKELKNFQVEYTGNGNMILTQSPEAGNRIAENSKIRLLLSN